MKELVSLLKAAAKTSMYPVPLLRNRANHTHGIYLCPERSGNLLLCSGGFHSRAGVGSCEGSAYHREQLRRGSSCWVGRRWQLPCSIGTWFMSHAHNREQPKGSVSGKHPPNTGQLHGNSRTTIKGCWWEEGHGLHEVPASPARVDSSPWLFSFSFLYHTKVQEGRICVLTTRIHQERAEDPPGYSVC